MKYYATSKLDGGPEKKYLRSYGYLYRNKAGKSVYHGPWCSFSDDNKKTSETIYIHGATKCTNDWDEKGKPISLEVFKSDDDHTQQSYEYWPSGDLRAIARFANVRYIPDKTGTSHQIKRVANGLQVHYYDNGLVRRIGKLDEFGGVQQEELFENGKSVGIAIYDRSGKKVIGRGRLGP